MVPDYQTLMRPVLASAEHAPRNIRDVIAELSDAFDLSAADRAQLLPSGKQTTMANRTHWARTYLKQAGLLTAPKRGWFAITDAGRAVLEEYPDRVDNRILAEFDAFQEFKTRGRTKGPEVSAHEDPDTPDENLEEAHERLEALLAQQILTQTRAVSPAQFEQVILDLLLAMGYGGVAGKARHIGGAGDDGVDGVIDQDMLGVDQIYVQAKRYGADNTIGAGAIRDFFGALSLKRATKGIFLTTSSFSEAARRTAADIGARIVLIDGDILARMMIRHDVGCRTKRTLHIKELDEAYFDDML
ncbi:MAG: restriction endonuclease [Shimia sp.]